MPFIHDKHPLIHIAFFNQLIFHTPRFPQLSQFIHRTETQRSPSQATIYYSEVDISLTLSQLGMPHHLALRILCENLDWQISSMAELCEGLFPTISHVEELHIGAPTFFQGGQDEIDLIQLEFLDLFRQFINVRSLCITGGSVLHVAGALAPISEQLAVIVLPDLREIYVGAHTEFASGQSGLAPFIAARERSTRPVFIHSLGSEPSQNLQSHADFIPTASRGNRNHHSQRGHPILIPGVGVLDSRSLHRNPHLLGILNLAGFFWGHPDIYPGQASQVNSHQRLAFPSAFGSHFAGEIVQSNSVSALVLLNGMVAMYERLSMEWRWEVFMRMWAHSSMTVSIRQNTLSALRSILVAGLTTPLPYTFGCLGRRLRMPQEHASYLIERGQLELAVETIEQGKELIWSEMSELRSSSGQLRMVNPNLADRLVHFNQALEAINIPISQNQEDSNAFDFTFEELQELIRGHQEVIGQIQALEGFASFMKATPFHTLQSAAAQGPIILINHCHWRCDILIVLHDSPPSLIPTNERFYERASSIASRLR